MNKSKRVQSILNLMVIISGVLSFFGWFTYETVTPLSSAIWSALYKTLQTFLFGANFTVYPVPVWLKVAVFIAPLSMAGSILFRVFSYIRVRLIGVALNLFSRNHIVLMGTPDFCRALLNRGEEVKQRKVVLLPLEYEHHQHHFRGRKLTVICGDIEETRVWQNTGLKHAGNLIMSPGYYDKLDEIKSAIEPILRKRHSDIEINYALGNQIQREVLADSRRWFNGVNMDAHSFQIGNMAASVAAAENAPHLLLGKELVSRRAVHIALDGFNDFCMWYILEAAHLYHYPSFENLSLTLISDKKTEIEQFLASYPGLKEIINLTVLPRSEYASKWHFPEKTAQMGLDSKPDMVVCFPDDPWTIPSRIRTWRRWLTMTSDASSSEEPIICFLPERCPNKETFLNFDDEWSRLKFSLNAPEDYVSLTQILENREVIDGIAREIHISYSGRNNAKNWNRLNDREKNSNRRSARHLCVKLQLLGYDLSDDPNAPEVSIPDFTDEESDLLAKLEHRRWNAEKYIDGFCPGTFPSDEDGKDYYKNVLRIHQDIRPFDELTEEDIQKDKDTFALHKILKYVLGMDSGEKRPGANSDEEGRRKLVRLN